MKRSFFQAAVVSILLYGCTTWTLKKRLEKKVECCEHYWTSPGGNTPQGINYTATYLPSRKLSKSDKPDMQLEHTYSSSERIRDVALNTCQRRWTIGRSGEKGQGYPCWRHDMMMVMMSGTLFTFVELFLKRVSFAIFLSNMNNLLTDLTHRWGVLVV